MLLSVLRGLIRRSPPNIEGTESAAPAASLPRRDEQRLLELAFARFQAKNYAEAEQALIQALRFAADNIDVRLLLAVVMQAQGRAREALDLLRDPLGMRNGPFELQVGIARAAAAAGEPEIALQAYQAAISQRPEVLDLHVALASAYEAMDLDAEAIGAYRHALRLDPRHPGIHLNLGHLLQKRGDLQEACSHFEAELELTPASVKSLFNLGVALDQLGDSIAAERYFRKALELEPGFSDACINLGILLSRRGDFSAAVSYFEKSGKGGLPGMHFNIAVSLAHEGRSEEARVHFARAKNIPVDDLECHNDIGIMFFIHGCIDQARPLIEHAAMNAPAAPRMQFNLALVKLASGLSVEAWDRFAWRFHPAVAAAIERKHPIKQWHGEPLHGASLLIWGEQGVGDEMMFAGMYPQLEQCGARVLLECKSKLVTLFRRSFPWAHVIERRNPPAAEASADIDYQIAAGSLGRYLRASVDSFPRHGGYLLADETRVQYWRRRLSQLGAGLAVGFCWRSSNVKADRALSCTRLDDWGELFSVPRVHWVCLQYDECEAELQTARQRFGIQLHRFEDVDYFDDLDEACALMKALDLVISAPTTISVQAAALGIATWQMSYGVDWQTHGTGRNLWFPTVTRFQRRWDQTWREVLAGISSELRARVDDSA
jgi:Flp pilus assembly protein TadD